MGELVDPVLHPWGPERARCGYGETITIWGEDTWLACSQRVGHRDMHSLVVHLPNTEPVRCPLYGMTRDGHRGQCILLIDHAGFHRPEERF